MERNYVPLLVFDNLTVPYKKTLFLNQTTPKAWLRHKLKLRQAMAHTIYRVFVPKSTPHEPQHLSALGCAKDAGLEGSLAQRV